MKIECVPYQHIQGMRAYQQCNEINKYFALTSKRNKEKNKVAKDLCFTNTTLDKYLTDNYAL